MKTHVNQKLRKTDVNNLRACGEGRESALAGARLEQQAPDLIGWLIYRLDTEQLAYRYSTFIEKETEVVQLHDLGDKLLVLFS